MKKFESAEIKIVALNFNDSILTVSSGLTPGKNETDIDYLEPVDPTTIA